MYHKLVRNINRSTEYLSMALLLIMVGLVFLQIVMREVLNYSFSWTEEVARYLLVWVSFLASGFAYQYGAHISIEVFVKKLNINIAKMVKIFVALIGITFAFILIITGIELSLVNAMNKSPALKLPMGIVYLAIPIGAFLQIINIIDLLFSKKTASSVEVSR